MKHKETVLERERSVAHNIFVQPNSQKCHPASMTTAEGWKVACVHNQVPSSHFPYESQSIDTPCLKLVPSEDLRCVMSYTGRCFSDSTCLLMPVHQ